MAPPRKWLPFQKTCRACGKTFLADTQYKIRVQEFCDRICRTKVFGNGRKKKRIARKCKQCKTWMYINQHAVKTKFYCSIVCRSGWQKEHGVQAGENNGAWKGGTGNNGAYWKRRARERDDFTCQFPNCGHRDEGKSTHAHHTIPRFVGGPDSLDNLKTLCHHHHQQIEREAFRQLMQKYPKTYRKIVEKFFKA